MIPRSLTEKVSNRAVEELKSEWRRRGWHNSDLIRPFARRDITGVRIGEAWRLRNSDERRGRVSPFRNLSPFTTIDPLNAAFDAVPPEEYVDEAMRRAFDLYSNEMDSIPVLGNVRRLAG